MDTRNVIAAISLSAAVIILYSLYFAPPPITKENLAEKNRTEQKLLKIIFILLIFFNYKASNDYCTPNDKYQYW